MRRELMSNDPCLCTNRPVKRINGMSPDPNGDYMITNGLGIVLQTKTNGLYINTIDAPDAIDTGFISIGNTNDYIMTSSLAPLEYMATISGQQFPNDAIEALNVGGSQTDDGQILVHKKGILTIQYGFDIPNTDYTHAPYLTYNINGNLTMATHNYSGSISLFVDKDDVVSITGYTLVNTTVYFSSFQFSFLSVEA